VAADNYHSRILDTFSLMCSVLGLFSSPLLHPLVLDGPLGRRGLPLVLKFL